MKASEMIKQVHGEWKIKGIDPKNGNMIISNGFHEVGGASRPNCTKIIEEHNQSYELLLAMADKLNEHNPEAFDEIWDSQILGGKHE